MRIKLIPLLSILASFLPANADVEQRNISCPGLNTIEMRWCAAQKLQESRKALHSVLAEDAAKSWQKTAELVCDNAYSPYRSGSIYRQMILGCYDRLNRALLNDFTLLGGYDDGFFPSLKHFLF